MYNQSEITNRIDVQSVRDIRQNRCTISKGYQIEQMYNQSEITDKKIKQMYNQSEISDNIDVQSFKDIR